jgi:hypothetical protein
MTCSRRRWRLPPRDGPDLFEAPLFPGPTDANLRMAIARACKATGTSHFRRTGSGAGAARCTTGAPARSPRAELLGDSKRVAADHYVYALTDYGEVAGLSRSREQWPPHE